ncbi:unnamed protein product [Triticum turgidum subsp. durum]|uniref:Uncharacterized protein n=1 Tax=Triticum turgidum subsp. durum TaxID=4567 RepID=A0A9R1QY46_TRITD|nr:unnamed protein product [Triticum turgidum subsp. durum]
MERKAVCISLVIFALVLFAGPDPVAAAVYSVGEVVMPMSPSLRLEDSVSPELGVDLDVHRRVFGDVGKGALDPNKSACKPKCAGDGQPYTGRGCQAIYGCVPK